MSPRTEQLSFDVTPRHAGAGVDPSGPPAEVLGAELKLNGALGLDVNLEHGDELVVTIAGADGEVLARSEATVSAPPSFVPIEEDKVGLVGYVRSHKAKLGERLA